MRFQQDLRDGTATRLNSDSAVLIGETRVVERKLQRGGLDSAGKVEVEPTIGVAARGDVNGRAEHLDTGLTCQAVNGDAGHIHSPDRTVIDCNQPQGHLGQGLMGAGMAKMADQARRRLGKAVRWPVLDADRPLADKSEYLVWQWLAVPM